MHIFLKTILSLKLVRERFVKVGRLSQMFGTEKHEHELYKSFSIHPAHCWMFSLFLFHDFTLFCIITKESVTSFMKLFFFFFFYQLLRTYCKNGIFKNLCFVFQDESYLFNDTFHLFCQSSWLGDRKIFIVNAEWTVTLPPMEDKSTFSSLSR